MKQLIWIAAFLLAAPLLRAGNGLEVHTDARIGYSFLSSEDNTFFRNHLNLSEGELIQNLKFSVLNKDEQGWYSRFSLEARTGDRLGTGRMVHFTLEKTSKWSLSVKQRQDFDWFSDSSYNFGASDRDLARSTLDVNFRYTGFKNLTLVAGYGLHRTKGNAVQPFTQWLDVYALKLKRDVDLESWYTGATWQVGSFLFNLKQSFVTLDRPVETSGTSAGIGLNGVSTTLDTHGTGKVSSDLPCTSVNAAYSGNRLLVDVSATYQDASIDNNVENLNSFFFTDAGSRNDFLATYAGNTDAPLYTAQTHLSYLASETVTVGYSLNWRSLRTETTMDKNLDWLIYGTGNTPLVTISQSENLSSLYKHSEVKQGVFVRWRATKSLELTAKGSSLDGTYRFGPNYAGSDTSVTHVELAAKYKFNAGSASASVFQEDTDEPLFRTAGKNRTGFSVSGSWIANQYWSLNGMMTKITRNNDAPDTRLSDNSTLYDFGLTCTPKNSLSVSFGYTRMELDFSSLVFLAESDSPLTDPANNETRQNAFYVTGSLKGKRWEGRLQAFYLDDSGRSLPLDSFQCTLDLQYRLTANLFSLASVRYFDYSEDFTAFHNYNFNQIIIGIRWVSR